MKKRIAQIACMLIVAAVVIVSVAANIRFYKTLVQQQDELANAKNTLELTERNYNVLKESYNVTNARYGKLKDDYSSLSTSSQKQEIEVEKTKDKLEDFETTVRDSMKWFKENNNLNKTTAYEEIKTDLQKCVVNRTGVCEIKLGCIYAANRVNGIRYESDDEAVKKNDFLKSLDLIYAQKGGDCEDLSLLFTAEYNFLAGRCREAGYQQEELKASTEDKIIEDAEYMYTVCGSFDPEKTPGFYQYVGHCVVALTGSPIKSSEDVYESIRHATLVEPQTGEVMFQMGIGWGIKIFKDGQAPDTAYHISTVITDNDLKIYYPWGEDVRWMGYGEFVKEVEAIKAKVGG